MLRLTSDSFLNGNPEFQFSVSQLTKAMQNVQKAYVHMCDSWQQRKVQLDQGIQLRMFEADCQKVDFSFDKKKLFAGLLIRGNRVVTKIWENFSHSLLYDLWTKTLV